MTPGHKKLLDIIREHVDDTRPDLSPSQRLAISEAIAASDSFETARNEGWSFPQAGTPELAWHVTQVIEKHPELARPAPSAQQTAAALVAAHVEKHGKCDPQLKLTLGHHAEQMSDDERWTATRGLKIAPSPETSSDAVPKTPTDAECDQLLNERGFETANLMPSQVRRYRAEIRKQFGPRTVAGGPTVPELLRAKGAKTDDDFSAITNPEKRIQLYRRAQDEKLAAQSREPASLAGDLDVHSDEFKRLPPQERIRRYRIAGGK